MSLILTLALDAASQAFFEEQRQRWFPRSRNLIGAHVTLFHRLPGEALARLQDDLVPLCRMQAPCTATACGVRLLGRGVAYTLHAPAIAGLRAHLATLWQAELTAQDRQPWQAHVTVQNKVDPAEARALHARLLRDFTPFDAVATGVALWRYLGGPWSSEGGLAFTG